MFRGSFRISPTKSEFRFFRGGSDNGQPRKVPFGRIAGKRVRPGGGGRRGGRPRRGLPLGAGKLSWGLGEKRPSGLKPSPQFSGTLVPFFFFLLFFSIFQLFLSFFSFLLFFVSSFFFLAVAAELKMVFLQKGSLVTERLRFGTYGPSWTCSLLGLEHFSSKYKQWTVSVVNGYGSKLKSWGVRAF